MRQQIIDMMASTFVGVIVGWLDVLFVTIICTAVLLMFCRKGMK